MTSIDLFWLFFFVGGGSFAGWRLGGWLGGILGGIVGFGLLYVVARLNAWELSKWPHCRCGTDQLEDFEVLSDERKEFPLQCKNCGRKYLMREARVWDELSEDYQRTPFMRRRFFGDWKEVDSRDKS